MQSFPPLAPGTLTLIGGIKTALIDDHHEAFYWWWKSKLRDATLFHVDGHDDLAEAYVKRKLESEHDYALLNIANFICPAVHHDIVSHFYWLNPHSEKRRLLYYKGPQAFFSKLEVALQDRNYKYGWLSPDAEKIMAGEGEILPPNRFCISEKRPLILDIDLDAFCCHQKNTLSFLPLKRDDYESVLGFEKRIDQTMEVLATLPRPNLITIAGSQGNLGDTCYVPPFMVEEVGRHLALNLRKLYE